jgi:hypothetical protein
MPVRKSAGMHHSEGSRRTGRSRRRPERQSGRGGEREVLEPLAVLELAEREPLVLVLAALASLQRALEAGSAPRISHGSPPPRRSTTLRCTPSVTSPASSTAKIAHSTTVP